ncbi:maleylpyruvate isomerase N-terminal domain-containing protein [Terriglobus albidus]|uniref:maleylpyruvate isomerase N-terminal domain-containing protein n=1 Tax=Terriglobus albidus TaxID=1592106 RepID=UPI0021E078F5|nr:maleylpyruvate isomerase N-terminal domain-containing protein [Terriglobus albidus]
MEGYEPILCAPLLRKVDRELLRLLSSLTAEEWGYRTVSPRWEVRDVAAHLLDTALRKLSMVRDTWFVEKQIPQTPREVVSLVNRLNDEGVSVFRRLSPSILIELMETACEQSADFHESLDPFAQATFNVSWAGEEISANWFDTARELTERWHHQQQIRLATGRPGILTRELYHPVLDCFIRGLPFAYRHVDASPGTNLLLEISGECGGRWVLSREEHRWHFLREMPSQIACSITVPEEIAWMLFTKGIDRDVAKSQIAIDGDETLAEGVLGHVAIVG